MSFDVDVTVRRGDSRIGGSFVTGPGATILFGPSGVGKTSILQMVAGLLRPEAGHVRVAGETLFDADARIDVKPERRRIGYVFQEPRLFPHMRVAANLRSRMQGGGGDWGGIIAMLGIGHLLDRWPRSLSGAKRGGWRSAAPCSATPVSCCSTSLYRRSTARGGAKYSMRWWRCVTGPASRS